MGLEKPRKNKNSHAPTDEFQGRRLIPVPDAARYLGLAEKTLRNRLGPRAENPFPVRPKHIGRRVLFDISDLDAFVDALPSS
jgi:predicted DNA-binding transcriptional regulator AlpA